ncbi:nucleoporin NUP42-like [Leguminivora glycinivorella]|uniref:nucleoporin NUP42-like n=1 Tax=Leguminivora glycinivorella TaxID=1035111 RepID=UPI00200C1F13|nr:nucleoporin NUP42-like [Leguminivora glycinivorella]
MVVCKFFQEGYCRYGQNCRFEHVYGSKYSYHANAPTNQNQPKQAPGGVTDEQLVQQVQNDVQSALKGGQWLLSCYAPFKKPNFPGLADLSADEARLFIYEAKANNTVDQAVAYMNNLSKEARSKYEQLLTTPPHILRSLYNGETISPPFATAQTPQSVFGQANNASSVFRSAVQDTAKSVFSQATQNVFGSPQAQTQSIFGGPAQSQSPFGGQTQSQSPFGAQTQNRSPFGAQPQSQSPFGAQNAFGSPNTAQSIFAQANNSVDPAKSVFAQANTPSDPNSLFAQAATTQSPFGSAPASTFKSPFEQPSPFAQSSSTFQSNAPTSIFGQANVFQQTPVDDPAVYSNINDVTPEDLEMFKADSFKLGFIPEIPPPHSLCV